MNDIMLQLQSTASFDSYAIQNLLAFLEFGEEF